jgi:hypothetical protein
MSELQQLITVAQTALSQTVEGSQAGQYPVGSKSQLQAQITIALAVKNNTVATQLEVNQAAIQLSLAINQFKNQRITTVLNLGYLVLMGQQYGKSEAGSSDWDLVKQYDVNHDNVINIFDLIEVANLI